ncbi:MAG TPA: trypsin-like peptidase domain-containing protein [Gemmatimonadaceae bacterium]
MPYAYAMPLGTATAFVANAIGVNLLVTNYHVLAGRHPDTAELLPNTVAAPDRLLIPLLKQTGSPLQWRPVVQELHDDQGPLWVEHPTHGHAFDVVALPLAVPDDVQVVPYPLDPGPHLALHMASEVAVIGFPEGMTASGLTAFWKSGTVASEYNESVVDKGYFWIDSNTRRGMSGAPVIARRFGTSLMEDGSVSMHTGVSDRALGVYAGRAFDAPDMTLGRVWGWSGVQELLTHAAEQVLLQRSGPRVTSVGFIPPANPDMPTLDVKKSVDVPVQLPNGAREVRTVTVGQLLRDLALGDPRFADSLDSVKLAAKIEAAIKAAEEGDGKLKLEAADYARVVQCVEKPLQGFNPLLARFILPLLDYIVTASKTT